MNPFGDALQHWALLQMPRMPRYSDVFEAQKAPGMDVSDLKCVELRRLGLFQDSYCSAANGNIAPRSPGSALKSASHKNEIPTILSNLPVQIVAIQIRDRLPTGRESLFLRRDRIRNERINLKQNSTDF